MTEQEKSNQPVSENEELSDEQLEGVAGGVRPPSGDLNPSDLGNRTVDTSDVIDPHGVK